MPPAWKRGEAAVVIVAATAATALAWAALAIGPGVAGGAGRELGSPMAGLVLAFAMWSVMMVAMMLPGVLPWVLTFVRLTEGTPAGRAARLGAFLSGYALAWGGFAVAAAAVQVWLQGAGWLSGPGALHAPAAGAVLLVVGAYQVTPLKDRCLSRCRSPVSFFLSRWRDGIPGAVRMGVGHGAHCVACCWGLMAAAFALGVMNLAWMAVLTLVVAAEKILPAGRAVARAAGWAAMALGVGMWLAR